MTKQIDEDFFDNRKSLKKEKKFASRKDRSKYKKTDFSKRQRMLQKDAESKLAKRDLTRGRVLSILPEEISIESQGLVYPCVLRGALKKEAGRIKNLIIVGDFVLFDPKDGMIVHVEERKTVLSRREHLEGRKEQLIAANIDQVLITVSIGEPPLKPALVDRYLIAAEKGKMESVIVINKMDLFDNLSEEDKEQCACFLKLYSSMGFTLVPLSSKTGQGIDQLKTHMRGKASVFSGQSGVGKSSLINALTGFSLRTREIVKSTRKGAHTTSSAHLIPLEFGGWCIDTPGIRSFGIWNLRKEDLLGHFWEIHERGRLCKYPDCSHTHEPGCAVLQALKNEIISNMRYDSYKKLLEEMSFSFPQ